MKATMVSMVLAAAMAVVGCGDDEFEDLDPILGTGGSGGSAGMGGSAGTGGSGGMGGTGGMMEMMVHGCTRSTAEDLTGMAEVTITDDGNTWAVPHNRCIRVSNGTVVRWEGDFTAHPLVGGVSPTITMNSPITITGPGSGVGSVNVGFRIGQTAAEFPYFCDIHKATMQGVVYVDP